ncbi:MAG: alpha/beta hydrolase [Candidatus Omnitrophica bacterium]|nr:alpha/beta hydrolase [Candidatus Omnitrophota bacterium]
MATTKAAYQIFILLALIAGIIMYFRFIERRTLFFPAKEFDYTPAALKLEYEEVSFKTKDNVEINAWFVPARDAKFTVLFAHGNAGNISHRVEKIDFFHELGLNVLIFDYRGYGKSRGSPSEKGLYKDAQASYEYLLSRGIKPDEIIGYGESIGGAVIIDLGSRNKLTALISDSTPSSAKDMVRIIYPFLPYWVFSVRMDSLSKVKAIHYPKLFIHSVNDEIVPFKLGKKLFESAPLPKEFLQIHGGHNSCFFESEDVLKEKVSAFLKGLK